ncbi:hypothetical protein PENSPDRAFT_672760, partial [Peniophora sp. CONT]
YTSDYETEWEEIPQGPIDSSDGEEARPRALPKRHKVWASRRPDYRTPEAEALLRQFDPFVTARRKLKTAAVRIPRSEVQSWWLEKFPEYKDPKFIDTSEGYNADNEDDEMPGADEEMPGADEGDDDFFYDEEEDDQLGGDEGEGGEGNEERPLIVHKELASDYEQVGSIHEQDDCELEVVDERDKTYTRARPSASSLSENINMVI